MFAMSRHMSEHPTLIGDLGDGSLWWKLSTVITCGTLAGAIIPEFVKVFTSTESRHVREVVTSSREGGASLNILSGFVAGNFSAYWLGLAILTLMGMGYLVSLSFPMGLMLAPAVFAFGLVAFGFLGMGPVTIAVDSYGPVTDNAQSVYELSTIEQIPGIKENIKKDFGGSSLLTAGCHALDALLFLVNDTVEEVTTYGTRSKNRLFEPYEYDTTTVTLLKFRGGSVGKVASVVDCLQPYYFHVHLVGSEGSLLDNTLVVWTNELGKGNSHTLDDIPFVLVGNGLDFKMGRSLKFDRQPHNRLLMSLAHGFGHHIERFGNPDYCGEGILPNLT